MGSYKVEVILENEAGGPLQTTEIEIPPGAVKGRVITYDDAAEIMTGYTIFPIPPQPLPPLAPDPLPEFIVHGADKIPVPGGLNVWAARNGFWDEPSTWSTGKVPTAADRVRIPAGAMVTLDGDCVCDVLVVDGGCIWAPESERTTLTLATLFGMPSGQFLCRPEGESLGVPLVERDFTCLFRPAPPDPADPAAYWGGLVWLGEFTVHGKKKSAYVDHLDDISAGDLLFTMASGDTPEGWEVGDEILVHDTRQLGQKERPLGYNQIERRKISDFPGGGEIGVSERFSHFHFAGRDDTELRDVPMRVVNMTRNVRFVAEVPGTVHVMFTGHAKPDLRYCAFVGMGRTRNEPLGPANPIARYPLHFHHMHTSFHLEGVVVDGGDLPHNRKFGIVVHDCHYSTIKDCTVQNAMGSGIYQEVGNEWGNVFDGCTVIGVDGKGGRADAAARQGGEGMQGTGFWVRGPGCKWVGNYGANCTGYGFTFTEFYLGQITYPDGPGSHVMVKADGNALGIAEFKGNTAFACRSGLTTWWTGVAGNKPRPNAKETLIEDFTSVAHWEYAHFFYPGFRLTLKNFRTRGNGGALGIYGADYYAEEFQLLEPDIQGQRTGWSVSVNSGPQLCRGGRISAESCVNLNVPWTSGARADGLFPRLVTIDGTKLAGKTLIARLWPGTLGGRTMNLMVLDRCLVKNWQGKAGDDFEIFMVEQAPAFVPPASVPSTYGGLKIVGAPVDKDGNALSPGATNAELWASHKVAVAGAVAPAGAKARAGVKGVTA